MKKIDLGQAIGILANVGVIAGIVFLAVELRQNNELLATQITATRAASAVTVSALDQEFLLTIGESPTTAKLWATYLETPEVLPEDQWLQGTYLMATVIRRLENIIFQRQLGSLSEEGWASRQPLFNIVRSPGFAAYLESPSAALMNTEFLDYATKLSSGE